jgi:hypothetical protein
VDGLSISNDGRVRRDGMSPLDFRVMFSLKLVGEPISLVMCDDVFSLQACCNTIRSYRRSERIEIDAITERLPELIPSTWSGKKLWLP